MKLKNDSIRVIDFQEIFEIQNKQQKKKETIAISIMMPEETIHAMAIDDSITHHHTLAKPIYEALFGQTDFNVSPYCIEIRYAIYSPTKKIAYVILPLYVTERQYDELVFMEGLLSASGFEFVSLQTDFDPTVKTTKSPNFVQEIEGNGIFQYLRENNLVYDYILPFERTKTDTPEEEPKAL